MGLAESVRGAVKAGFKALGNIAVSATYKRWTTAGTTDSMGGYGAATYTDTTITGLKSGYSSREVAASGGLISPGDCKFMIQASSLTTAPNTKDRVTLGGVTYDMVNFRTDPATATYTLQLRERK